MPDSIFRIINKIWLFLFQITVGSGAPTIHVFSNIIQPLIMASEFITNPKDLIAVADLKQILLIDKGAHVLYDSYQIASYLGNDRSRFG